MAYTPTNWVNDSAPAINATNLNNIETGIDEAHDDLDAATDAATAGELVRRDGSGRAKVATPSATGDIATKGYVDGLASNYATAAQGGKADTAVQPSLVDAKGDLLVGTADNTVGRLPAGTDGQTIVYDSGEATGMRPADFPSGGSGVAGSVFLEVNLGSGTGPTLGANSWTTIPFDNVVTNVGGGSFNTGTYIFTIPSDGLYLCLGGVRINDSSSARGVGLGVGTSNADAPFVVWDNMGGIQRNGRDYQRLTRFTSGDQVRMFMFSTSTFDFGANSSGSSLQIMKVAD